MRRTAMRTKTKPTATVIAEDSSEVLRRESEP